MKAAAATAATAATRLFAEYNRRQMQANMYLQVGRQVHGMYKLATDECQRRFGYVVYVAKDDTVFNDLLAMLLAQLPPKKQRLLQARSELNNGWDDERDCEVDSTAHVDVSFSNGIDRVCQVNGVRMRVTLVRSSLMRPGSKEQTAPGLYFQPRNVAGRDAVVELMRQMAEKRISEPESRDPNLYLRRQGHWQRTIVPFRPSESVILAEGQLERIATDLSDFLDSERFYVRRSLPWHRGYLFHGPPGTGKTSLVRGLAKHFGLDLWTISLGDLDNDSELVGLVSEIRSRSILLLEDVDVYSTVHARQKTEGKASLSGLLNTLDGVSTPHGLITVMTTNHQDRIDPALLRPGRIDVVEELNAPTPDQARRLFEYFYEQPARADWSGVHASSVADLVETFKQHLHDPETAERLVAAPLRTGALVAS